MKKNIFNLMIMTTVLSTVSAFSQQRNNIKFDITGALLQTYGLSYEIKVKTNQSFQPSLFYTSYSGGGSTFNGIGISTEYRFYLSKSIVPNGLYIAPSVRFENFKIKDAFNQFSHNSYGASFVIGKQWVFKSKLSVDVFAGPAYTFSSISRNLDSTGDFNAILGTDTFTFGSIEGFGLRTGLLLGGAF